MKSYKLKQTTIKHIVLAIAASSISATSFAAKPNSHSTRLHKKASKRQKRTQRHLNDNIANILGWQASKTSLCNLCGGYFKQPTSILRYPNPAPANTLPTYITADGPTLFSQQGASILQKNVLVKQHGRLIKADKAYVYRNRKSHKITLVKFVGHVHMREAGKLITGPTAKWNLAKNTARFSKAAYFLAENRLFHNKKNHSTAWGIAKTIKRDANGVIELWDATYSTCPPVDPTWVLSAAHIKLNHKKGEGKAYNAVLKVHDIPVMYLPYYSFSINKQRKTGFLTPTLGYSKKKGGEFSLPFYWNMAPNYDMTITPHYMSTRGMQINTLFRYLTKKNAGYAYVSYLNNDREFHDFREDQINYYSSGNIPTIYQPYIDKLRDYHDDRSFYSFKDTTHFTPQDPYIFPRWSGSVNLNYVTDPYYFRDFGYSFGSIYSNQLFNNMKLDYISRHWTMDILAQSYQTLHLINQSNNPVENQFQRLPEFDANGYYPNLPAGLDFNLSMQAVHFDYGSDFPPFTYQEPIGNRLHFRPSLSRPIDWQSGYITPQLSIDNTDYYTKQAVASAGISRPSFNASRNLPIFDIDSGMIFDRHYRFDNHDYLQTLEPRLFYLYIPCLNQDKYPIFDSNILPFSYNQLFTLNSFSGFDRLNNANQLTMALTSHIYNTKTNLQTFSFGVGVIDYFTTPRVCISNGCEPDYEHLSPIVAKATYQATRFWSASASTAWSTKNHHSNNDSISLSYIRGPQRSATIGYEFVRASPSTPETDNLGFSTNTNLYWAGITWPITHRWSTLAYWYYNISHRQPENYYFGLQYSSCCWTARFIINKTFTGFATASTANNRISQFDTQYYIQILLKGLGAVGNSDPDSLLKSTIPGFEDPFMNQF